MEKTPTPNGLTRLRRIASLVLILTPIATVPALPLLGRWFDQMEVLWFLCHWGRYAGPAALILGVVLLLPDSGKAGRSAHFWGCAGFLAWLALLGLVVVGWIYVRPMLGHTWTMRELEDPGPYEAVVLEGSGRTELDSTVWGLTKGADRFERIASPQYPPCHWPIEVRRSARGPRYLVVDSRKWAVAVYDLDGPQVARVLKELPPLEELRDEFGDDLAQLSTFENEVPDLADEPR